MFTCANLTAVETAVSAATLNPAQATRLPLQLKKRGYCRGFTLAELLVTVGVLVLLVLLFTQLLNSSASITTLGHKQMDADSQAREVLDRMAIDFAQMVKRSDVDYYLKSPSTPQSGNDQIAFYAAVPGYYPTSPSPAPTHAQRSQLSLVSYRINSDTSNSASASYNRMERMGKGLAWNGFSSDWTPVVFLPQTISVNWPSAVSTATADSSYEVIGPQVFRFEYAYLLTNGNLSITPPSFSSIAAIIADIAVIDPKSKVLLTKEQIATFSTPGNSNFLDDYSSDMKPGQLRTQWQNKVNGITTLPRLALSGMRFYERFFYLSPPTF